MANDNNNNFFARAWADFVRNTIEPRIGHMLTVAAEDHHDDNNNNNDTDREDALWLCLETGAQAMAHLDTQVRLHENRRLLSAAVAAQQQENYYYNETTESYSSVSSDDDDTSSTTTAGVMLVEEYVHE